MNNINIQQNTIKIITKFISGFLVDQSICSVTEGQYIIQNLKHLSKHDELMPSIMPKLLTMEQSAEILNIGLSNYKKIERENLKAKEENSEEYDANFPKRRMIGKAVRYRNLDVYKYAMLDEDGIDDTEEE